LADLLDGADDAVWSAPSRCGDWTVEEVVAHLVFLAEGTRRSVFADVIRARKPFHAAVDLIARRFAADATPPELVARLRAAAGGTFVVPLMPATLALGEVLVHRADIADAAALPALPADEDLRAVLEAERSVWFAFGIPRSVRAARFRPTDGDWEVGPTDGPLVEGPGQSLLLAATGRPGLADVTGPGLSLLR
jgi:uncharacterized protein (TIGR03083 family)